MKRIILMFPLIAFLSGAAGGSVLAHNASISISAPIDGQEFVVDTLPAIITVEGTITHGSPGNVNDQMACVSVDGSVPICLAGPTGVGTQTSFNYSLPVEIGADGYHTIQALTDKPGGGHSGSSDIITINIVLTPTSCDEVDPPAYANQYLNDLNPPKQYAKYRGQIIRVIAFNHSNGVYGSCTYDYPAVKADVDALLAGLSF